MGQQAEETKVDENAGIPKQVLKDAADAEELHAKLFETSDEDDSTASADKVDTELSTADKDDDAEVNWEDRYKELQETHTTLEASHSTLKGKYNKELPLANSELKEFKQSVMDRLGNLETPEKKPVATTDTPEFQEKIEKFKEDYGDDFLDTIKESLMADINPLLANTIKPVADRVDTVVEDQVAVASQKFTELVTEATTGDWNSLLNAEVPDAKFEAFLTSKDPSGLYTYGNLLAMASDKWDAELFSKVFNLYYESVKPAEETEEAKAAREKAEKETPAKTAKEAMVAPSRTTPKVEPKIDDKIIWTQASMAQFEKDERTGKISVEKAKELWDDLLAAVGEGRITD